jgi:hypothetical protein
MKLDEVPDTAGRDPHFGALSGDSHLHPFDHNRRQIILLFGSFREFNDGPV